MANGFDEMDEFDEVDELDGGGGDEFAGLSNAELYRQAYGGGTDAGGAEGAGGGGDEFAGLSNAELYRQAFAGPARREEADASLPGPERGERGRSVYGRVNPNALPAHGELAAKGERGGVETAMLNRQEETGIESGYDGSWWGGIKNGFQAFAHALFGRPVTNAMNANLQALARGMYTDLSGNETPLEQLPDATLDYVMDNTGANGFAGARALLGERASHAWRGEGNVMRQWDEREGAKFAGEAERKRARVAYAKDLAQNMLSMQEESKLAASDELAARGETFKGALGRGLLEQGGYTARFMTGPYGLVAGVLEGAERAGELLSDKTKVDKNGEIVADAKRDTMGAALAKGAARGVIAPAVELVGGRLLMAGVKGAVRNTLGRIPLVKAAGGKLAATAAGKSVAAFARKMDYVGRMTGMGSFPEEMAEEWEDQVIDAAIGLDRRASENAGTTALGRARESSAQFFTAQNLGDLAKSMVLMQVVQGGAAHALDRMSARRVDAVLENVCGVERGKLRNWTANQKQQAFTAWVEGLSEEDVRNMVDGGSRALSRFMSEMFGGHGMAPVALKDGEGRTAGRALVRTGRGGATAGEVNEALGEIRRAAGENDFTERDADGNPVERRFTPQTTEDGKGGRKPMWTPAQDEAGNPVLRLVDAENGVTIDGYDFPGDDAPTYRVYDARGRQRAADGFENALAYANGMVADLAQRNAKLRYIRRMAGDVLRNQRVFVGDTMADVRRDYDAQFGAGAFDRAMKSGDGQYIDGEGYGEVSGASFWMPETDADGRSTLVPATNRDGSPVYETDAKGRPVHDAAGNPVQKTVRPRAVFFALDNNRSVAELNATAYHEVARHSGLAQMYTPEEKSDFLRRLSAGSFGDAKNRLDWDGLVRGQMAFRGKKSEAELWKDPDAVEEIFAIMTEGVTESPSLKQRFMANVYDWYRNRFRQDLDIQPDELAVVVDELNRFARRGGGAAPGGGVTYQAREGRELEGDLANVKAVRAMRRDAANARPALPYTPDAAEGAREKTFGEQKADEDAADAALAERMEADRAGEEADGDKGGGDARQTRKNAPAGAPTEAGATTPPRDAARAEGRKSGDAAVAAFDRNSTVLSGDEVRKTMPGYDPKDWRTHIDRTGYVGPRLEAQFRHLLKTRKGKGDGTVVFLAGGNGAGKSTVAAKIGNSHDFTIDSTLGNLEVAKTQIDAILANGQTPEIHFVYRTIGQALEGIAQRVKNGGHIVSPLSFANSHVKSRENLRLLSEAYGDKIHLHIYDNSVDGAPEITLKQLEAKEKPDHARIRESANYYLGHLREREEARSRSQGGVAGGGAKGEEADRLLGQPGRLVGQDVSRGTDGANGSGAKSEGAGRADGGAETGRADRVDKATEGQRRGEDGDAAYRDWLARTLRKDTPGNRAKYGTDLVAATADYAKALGRGRNTRNTRTRLEAVMRGMADGKAWRWSVPARDGGRVRVNLEDALARLDKGGKLYGGDGRAVLAPFRSLVEAVHPSVSQGLKDRVAQAVRDVLGPLWPAHRQAYHEGNRARYAHLAEARSRAAKRTLHGAKEYAEEQGDLRAYADAHPESRIARWLGTTMFVPTEDDNAAIRDWWGQNVGFGKDMDLATARFLAGRVLESGSNDGSDWWREVGEDLSDGNDGADWDRITHFLDALLDERAKAMELAGKTRRGDRASNAEDERAPSWYGKAEESMTEDERNAMEAFARDELDEIEGANYDVTDDPHTLFRRSPANADAAARREYDEVVARFTNADGTRKPGWMKAPNGKATNLTERQWVQVRAPSFKRWFGDWEREAELLAARDFVLSGDSVAEISGTEFQRGERSLVDRVSEHFAAFGGEAVSPALGRVVLNRSGVKSSVAHGIGSKKAAAFAAVKNVIENGVVFDRNEDWKGRGYGTAVIAAPIRIGAEDYVCEIVVARKPKGNTFYLHEVNLKEKLSDTIKTATGAVSVGESARPVRSIIAQRLSEVNPASVSKVVDANSEPLVVYRGASFDPIAQNPGEGVIMEGAYFSPNPEYAKRYGKVRAYYLNIRSPFDIRDRACLRDLKRIYPDHEFATGISGALDWGEATVVDQEFLEDNFGEKYDGLVYDEGGDVTDGESTAYGGMKHRGISYVPAKGGAQVKSATENAGAFDPANPDIRFSVARGKDSSVRIAPAYADALTFSPASEQTAKTSVKAWRGGRKIFTNARNGRRAEIKSDWSKIFSTPAKKKSASYEAHYAAANHIDTLFERSVKMWEEPPRNGSNDIRAYAKYGCPFSLGGETYLAKITVKEYADRAATDGLYSVEAISVEKISAEGINAGITSLEGHELDLGATDALNKMLTTTPRIVPHPGPSAQGGGARFSVSRVTPEEDAAYLDAVKRGDMETAQRLLKSAWERSGYSDDTSYKDAHAAPCAPVDAKDFRNAEALLEARNEGWDLNLWAVAKEITGQPDDFFSDSGPRLYGYDDAAGRETQEAVAQTIDLIRAGVDNAKIVVYRAVPKSVKLDALQSGGQWVSPSRTYAENHGKSRFGIGKYRVVREVVRADELWWDGNDAREWGYDDGRQYVYMNGENGKKLATVTYDGSGNVIPLSERFNPAKGDMRFSIGRLYTGSAADYERPSLVHVGTGEGSQVYGWGLYASDRRNVAEGYAARGDTWEVRKNGQRVETSKDDAAWHLGRFSGFRNPVSAALKDARSHLRNGESREFYEKVIKDLKSGGYEVVHGTQNVYEQTFFTDRAPGDESRLLKWYEPVGEEQARWIFKALMKVPGSSIVKNRIKKAGFADFAKLKGEIVYKLVADVMGEVSGREHDEKAASEFLARAGIDGVKYPADSYGGKGVKDSDEADWNYVSFRDDNIRVDHKWTDGQMRFSVARGTPNEVVPKAKYMGGDDLSKEDNARFFKTYMKNIAPSTGPKKLSDGSPKAALKWFIENMVGKTYTFDIPGIGLRTFRPKAGHIGKLVCAGANKGIINRKYEGQWIGAVLNGEISAADVNGWDYERARSLPLIDDMLNSFDAAIVDKSGRDMALVFVKKYTTGNGRPNTVVMKVVQDGATIGPVSAHVKDLSMAWLMNKKRLVINEDGEPLSRNADNSASRRPLPRDSAEGNSHESGDIIPHSGPSAQGGGAMRNRRYTPDPAARLLADALGLSAREAAALAAGAADAPLAVGDDRRDSMPGAARDLVDAVSDEEGIAAAFDTTRNLVGRLFGKGAAERWRALRRSLRRRLTNYLEPVVEMQRLVERRTLHRVRAEDSVADAAKFAYSHQTRMWEDAEREVLAPLYKEIAENGLDAPAKSIGEGTVLHELLLALHGPAFNRMISERTDGKTPDGSGASTAFWLGVLRGHGANGTDAQILGALARGDYAALGWAGGSVGAKAEKAVSLVRELTGRTRDVLERSGRLGAKQRATWEALSPFYVPMRFDQDADDNFVEVWLHGGTLEGGGYARNYAGGESRHAFGHKNIADNPIVFALQQHADAIQRATDNDVRRKLADMVRRNEFLGHVVDADGIVDMGGVVNPRAPSGFVGLPRAKTLGADAKARESTAVGSLEQEDNIVAFKEGGDVKFIVLGPRTNASGRGAAEDRALSEAEARLVGRAVKKTSLAQVGPVLKFIRGLTRTFGQLRTTLSPEFLVSNFLADNAQAAGNVYATFGAKGVAQFERGVPAALASARRMLDGKLGTSRMDAYAREMREGGGLIGGLSTANFADVQRDVEREVAKFAGDRKVRVLDFISHMAERMNAPFEVASRLSAYAVCRENGMTRAEAAKYAREVTVDFNQKGEWTPVLNALYAFSNASLVDMERSFGAYAARRGLRLSFALVALGFLSSMLGYWQDDPDGAREGAAQWKDTKDYVKQNKLGFRAGTNLYSVPIRGVNRVLYYAGHKLWEVLSGRQGAGEAALEVGSFAASNLVDPIGDAAKPLQAVTPSVLRPGMELLQNESFSGAQIYREPMNKRLDVRSAMGRRTTPGIWHNVAEAMNAVTGGNRNKRGAIDVQPEVYQYVYSWLTGSAGDDIARAANVVKDIATWDFSDMEDARNMPFVRRFTSGLQANTPTFREKMDEFKEDVKQFKDVANEDPGVIADLRARHPFFGASPSARRWLDELTDLGKAARKLMKAEMSLDGEDRKAAHRLRLQVQAAFIHRFGHAPEEDTADDRAFARSRDREAAKVIKANRK